MNGRGDWIGVVPIRGGSKGLPGKNTRPLLGKPLYRHAVDLAFEAGARHCLITTDIAEVLKTDHGPDVTLVSRPADLAGDETPIAPVLTHAFEQMGGGDATLVLLQATSPLRRLDDIRAALKLYGTGRFDLVLSTTRTSSGILKFGFGEDGAFRPVSDPSYCFTNRQSLPAIYRPNGAVYVFSRDWYLLNGGLETERMGMIEMDEARSLDIDTAEDFAKAEAQLRARD